MGELLALTAAGLFGVTHFVGGLLSRRAPSMTVSLRNRAQHPRRGTFSPRQQPVAVATVLTALYPAIPVVLALLFLHERLNRWQVSGLVGAATSIALIVA